MYLVYRSAFYSLFDKKCVLFFYSCMGSTTVSSIIPNFKSLTTKQPKLFLFSVWSAFYTLFHQNWFRFSTCMRGTIISTSILNFKSLILLNLAPEACKPYSQNTLYYYNKRTRVIPIYVFGL